MAITVSDISAMVARVGNKVIHEQVNQKAKIATQYLPRFKQDGQVGYVNIKAGGVDATGWIADQGALPARANQVTPVQGVILPKYLFSRVEIPRGAATLATGKKDGINIVLEELASTGAHLGRQLALACFTRSLQTLTSTQATELGAAGTTLTANDASGFRVGDVVERRDSSNALQEFLRVVRVQIDDDGTSHTITFDRDITSIGGSAPAASDVLYARGAYSNGMVSLTDVHAAANLYSLDYTLRDWEGNLKTVTGALDPQDLRDLWTKAAMRSGSQPSCLVSNSRNLQLYMDTLVTNRRYISGKMDHSGGVEADFNGRPFKVDESCPGPSIFALPGDETDVRLAVFKDFSDDGDGGLKPASASGFPMVAATDTSYFEYTHQRWGAFNMSVRRRSGGFHLTGIGT